ncbi:hypothetical protein EH165_08925 [Nakamurella antarctica]|uniref:Uncharacterized protein n=1 Tax=Nakamurella antarctica TaxID=1902245 RepID=A0A3G8ZLY5_9ACTN|nr:hypothetical protein [Nakamurella antarctica]AZI58240.1 hypothetical protein EH165_08925 [Nakamurella antarctica]
MRLPFSKARLSPALRVALEPDEQLISVADIDGGGQLAVTRLGLWHVPDGGTPVRTGWEVISKARWAAGILEVTVADVVGELASAQVLVDRQPVRYAISEPRRTTDQVHTRTRGGVVHAGHHTFTGGSGWIILRKVPGCNGLQPQVRFDAGTDPASAAVQTAVRELITRALRALQPEDDL